MSGPTFTSTTSRAGDIITTKLHGVSGYHWRKAEGLAWQGSLRRLDGEVEDMILGVKFYRLVLLERNFLAGTWTIRYQVMETAGPR